MGDNGGAYGIYTEGLRERMVQLVRSAQVITPNLTEALLLLYGKEEMEKSVLHVAQLLGIEEILKRYPDELSVGQRQMNIVYRQL